MFLENLGIYVTVQLTSNKSIFVKSIKSFTGQPVINKVLIKSTIEKSFLYYNLLLNIYNSIFL